jgi:hypothetical protein
MKKGDDYVTRMNLYNLIFWMVILLYDINKMSSNGDGGVVVCVALRRLQAIYWSRVEIPTRMQIFFSLIFVRIHTNEFIQLLYKSCSTNSYTVWFLYQFVHFFIRIVYYEFIQRAASAQREPAKPEHTSCPDQSAPGCPDVRVHPAAPTLGYTRLPRPLGCTRLPRR